jgi:hypothetical protein
MTFFIKMLHQNKLGCLLPTSFPGLQISPETTQTKHSTCHTIGMVLDLRGIIGQENLARKKHYSLSYLNISDEN